MTEKNKLNGFDSKSNLKYTSLLINIIFNNITQISAYY